MKYAYSVSSNRDERLQIITAESLYLVSWNHDRLRAPYWRLYWNAEAGAHVISDGAVFELLPDRILLIPPDTNFSSRNTVPVDHFYVHFLCHGRIRKQIPYSLPLEESQQAKLRDLGGSDRHDWNEWHLIELLAYALAATPTNAWSERMPVVHRKLDRALSRLHRSLPAPTSTRALALEAGMNVNAFIRLFRETTGDPPTAYQHKRRIEAACIYLHHSDQSIDHIAEVCGFCDRHHFSRVFKRIRKVTPAEFRKQRPEA